MNLLAFVLFVVGAFCGLQFADFDQRFAWYPLIVHRSLLTHGFLVPVLLAVAFRKSLTDPRGSAARCLVMGFSIATSVHLAFDLFPKRWGGYAMVHIPLMGWSPYLFSILWLGLGIVVCLLLASLLLRNIGEFYMAFGGLVVTYGIATAREPHYSFYALLVLGVSAPLMFIVGQKWRGQSLSLPRLNTDRDGF